MKKLFFVATVSLSLFITSCTETSLEDEKDLQIDLRSIPSRPGSGRG